MSIYQGLAHIYDQLMENIDYQEWAQYMKSITEKYNKEIESVLDIACGTGNSSIPLAQMGLRVTGVDLSQPMLQQARKKSAEAKTEIIFLQQDIKELELSREFDLATCFQDGLNYLINEEEITSCFQSISRTLSDDGMFIFDLNAVKKYSHSAQGEISFVDTEEFSLIYENDYLADEEIWEIRITGFVRGEDHSYSKFQEVHQEKHHHLKDVERILDATGFKVLDVFHAFSFYPPTGESRRIFVVAQKTEGRA